MVIYHVAVHTGSRNNGKSARAKYDYIEREGHYARRVQKTDVLHTVSANMPIWAIDDSRLYWAAADAFERANGRLYKEIEFALPSELSDDDKIKTAEAVAKRIAMAEHLPYTLAIHNNPDNPHCHLMVSERSNDGLYRPASDWFSRYDSTNPQFSGARKTTALMPKEWLEQLRKDIEQLINYALSRAGLSERVDCRSLAEQGIDRLPTVHEGPSNTPAHKTRSKRNAAIRTENARQEAERKKSRTRTEAIEAIGSSIPVAQPERPVKPPRTTEVNNLPSARQDDTSKAPGRSPWAPVAGEHVSFRFQGSSKPITGKLLELGVETVRLDVGGKPMTFRRNMVTLERVDPLRLKHDERNLDSHSHNSVEVER